MNDYYVYVYIDPRNLEEFYYGKGKGSRKNAHLFDESDSEKSKRIKKIREAGLEPTIRVVAANLTEPEALLIEATLIWKLGRFTANVAGVHFKSKFRPHDTYHAELSGFDFQNGIYYYNVGEDPHGEHRNWEDYAKYGFISAGQGERWRDQMLGFQEGDAIAAYITRRGFVGVGRVIQPAKRIRDVEIDGKRLVDLDLVAKTINTNSGDPVNSEYVALVEWIKTVPREQAKFKRKSGLYTPQRVRASLDNQPTTVDFINQEFGVDMRSLVK